VTPPHRVHGQVSICVRGPFLRRVDFDVDHRAGHTDRLRPFCWKVELWDTRVWGKSLWGRHNIWAWAYCKNGAKLRLHLVYMNPDPN
jgi:hypothetical protein